MPLTLPRRRRSGRIPLVDPLDYEFRLLGGAFPVTFGRAGNKPNPLKRVLERETVQVPVHAVKGSIVKAAGFDPTRAVPGIPNAEDQEPDTLDAIIDDFNEKGTSVKAKREIIVRLKDVFERDLSL